MIQIDVQMPSNCYDCWIRKNLDCRIANNNGWLNNKRADGCPLKKAQEPRMMTLEEVKSSVGNDMYLEISTRTDETPYITAATLDGVGQKGVVFYCDHFYFVAYNRRLYGWRCWTSKPTYEQMEMTPWN